VTPSQHTHAPLARRAGRHTEAQPPSSAPGAAPLTHSCPQRQRCPTAGPSPASRGSRQFFRAACATGSPGRAARCPPARMAFGEPPLNVNAWHQMQPTLPCVLQWSAHAQASATPVGVPQGLRPARPPPVHCRHPRLYVRVGSTLAVLPMPPWAAGPTLGAMGAAPLVMGWVQGPTTR